ncbi:MAG: exonuclease domain-containing protein [Oscillatoriaceae cyanobacterium Prado104]|jgi:inhibitor of KinA sporulation pathway (predicted exonuclease)|nr:exonuclease domain-containing protein [Oscillatoriaceae cyanobacterium Prado104]
MKNLKPFDYYLVLDLEATCCDTGSIAKNEMEIIEIGAVMVKAQTLEILDEFQTFVKPVRNPILTEFCKTLTSIAQMQVDRAPTYPKASAMLTEWLSVYSNGVFCSWGDFDRTQFKKDSNFHQLPFPIAYPHVNVKKVFSEIQGLPKRYGMDQALELAGLPLEGTHHRGIDDARNIAKLLPYILGQKKLE